MNWETIQQPPYESKVFNWVSGYNKTRLRVSIMGTGDDQTLMFTTPDSAGDTSFNDQIPVKIWREINKWLYNT